MKTRVVSLRHHLQVVWRVVSDLAVTVVDDLTWLKGAAYLLFGDHAVFVPLAQLAVRLALASIAQCCAVVLLPPS